MSANQLTTPDVVEYRQVGDDPGYRVGDDGSVWSLWGKGRRSPGTTWKQLRQAPVKGYPAVSLRGQSFYVHRLVLMAFVGPCPPGMEGCHNDGNPMNNRLENLRWDTHKANKADQPLHGTDNRGERHGHAKLTNAEIRMIRSEYAKGGISLAKLGSKHGVGSQCVSKIVRRTAWKHVE